MNELKFAIGILATLIKNIIICLFIPSRMTPNHKNICTWLLLTIIIITIIITILITIIIWKGNKENTHKQL